MSKFKTKFIDFFRLLFPSTGIELIVFLFFLVVYGYLGSYISIHHKIIFDARIPWDAYFSFDNKSIVMTGGSFERHPLSYYFSTGSENWHCFFPAERWTAISDLHWHGSAISR
ncbi:hypothetical protein ACFOEQ_16205 [Chryseobacterium arachidis]|uniref:hypothetical protein n=1 Tax=Chryseobacterium arachidis TaxID=1416778 RepID=UPI00361FA822